MRYAIHLILLCVMVILPIGMGLFSLLWLELCRAIFVAGGFLVLIAILSAYPFAYYCMPVNLLFGELCFSNAAFGTLMPLPLPCDFTAWAAVAAFYALIACGLAALIARRRSGAEVGWPGTRADTPGAAPAAPLVAAPVALRRERRAKLLLLAAAAVVMIHWRLPYALIEWDNWQANRLADQVAAEMHQAALWQEGALIAAAVAIFAGALLGMRGMRGKPA